MASSAHGTYEPGTAPPMSAQWARLMAKATSRPPDEHRPDRFHVGQVVAADLGEVQVPDVSVAELPPRHAPEELLHGEGHHAEVDGDVTALGDEPAARVGERARQVARLLEERASAPSA